MTRPAPLVVFIWRRKAGAAKAAMSHALAPTATVTAMCGTSTMRDTHWLDEHEGQQRCRVCIRTIEVEYPGSVAGVRDQVVEHFAELADRAIDNIVEHSFVVDANESQQAGSITRLDIARLFDIPAELLIDGRAAEQAFAGMPTGKLTLRHLHDWREHCNACPICDWHNGFHDEAAHEAREVPRHLLARYATRVLPHLPKGDERKAIRLTDDEIAELREAARQRREDARS